MEDDELIGYCELHCQTTRALFHFEHVNRMIELAAPSVVREAGRIVEIRSYKDRIG